MSTETAHLWTEIMDGLIIGVLCVVGFVCLFGMAVFYFVLQIPGVSVQRGEDA